MDDDGKPQFVTYGSAMDTQIIKELLLHCLKTQEVLGLDSAEEQAFEKEIRATLAKLPPFLISEKDGRLQEWAVDYKEENPQHRHLSHLYALYPGDLINTETPELLEAARKSMLVRSEGSGGGTGWNEGWSLGLWARLQDADRAAFTCNRLLATQMKYNLFNQTFSSPLSRNWPAFMKMPLEYVPLVDGNLAVTGALPELFVQSHLKDANGDFIIELLPALPDDWQDGSFSGLRVRGGFEVDLVWEAGRLKEATVTSITGKTGALRYGDTLVKLDMQPGQELRFNGDFVQQ